MGIAKMKKLTLLAEQKEKDSVLVAMQAMHNIEVISLRKLDGKRLINDSLHIGGYYR